MFPRIERFALRRGRWLLSTENLLYSSNLSVSKPHFDAVRMRGIGGKNLPDFAYRPASSRLVFFQHNRDTKSGENFRACSSVHKFSLRFFIYPAATEAAGGPNDESRVQILLHQERR